MLILEENCSENKSTHLYQPVFLSSDFKMDVLININSTHVGFSSKSVILSLF